MKDKKSTILAVDDNPSNIDIILELLGNDYDILVALNGESAFEISKEHDIDLILMDILMPDLDGFETCELLKNNSLTKDIPIIFITAKTDEDSIEKAYDVGGIDYVTKPFKPKELVARVKTQLELKSLIKHLEYISSYDMMTGIYNRRKFFELSLERFTYEQENLFCAMIDIDKFKQINDDYGHPIGDKVIKAISDTIQTNLCKNAIFGRIGGEEFAVLCNLSDKDIALSYIEVIRKSVEELVIYNNNNQAIKCTISAGLSKADEHTISLDQLLKEADKALYEAKGKGRNKSIFRKCR